MRMEATKQREIDEAMIKLDVRTDKSRLEVTPRQAWDRIGIGYCVYSLTRVVWEKPCPIRDLAARRYNYSSADIGVVSEAAA